MLGDWTLTVTGSVSAIRERNIDKTGRQQRHFVDILINPEQTSELPPHVTLSTPVLFTIKDLEYTRVSPAPVAVGERVTLVGAGYGATPESFYIKSITRLVTP